MNDHTTQAARELPPYDSNPFTTAFTGIVKLTRHNVHALIGVVIFNVLAGLVMVLSVVIMVGATIALLANTGDLTNILPPQIITVSRNMNAISVISTCAIGVILLVTLGLLMQLLSVKLTLASAQAKRVEFGQLFRQIVPRLLPALGMVGLLALGVAVPFLFVLLTPVIGPISIVLLIMSIVGAIYVAIRLTFVWFLVSGTAGPVAALRASWRLTDGRIAETIGIVGASAIIVTAPFVIINLISKNLGGLLGGLIELLATLAAFGAVVAVQAGYAERYEQFQQTLSGRVRSGKVDVLNYLAIVLYALLIATASTLTPQAATMEPGMQYWQTTQPFQGGNTDQPTTDLPYTIN